MVVDYSVSSFSEKKDEWQRADFVITQNIIQVAVARLLDEKNTS